MKLVNKKIFIISPEAWGEIMLSKHHYAEELAIRGNNVFFINPPSKNNNVRLISNNLYIVDYKPVMRGVNRLPGLLRNILNKLDIQRIKKRTGVTENLLIWSFDPFRFQNLTLFNAELTIYHRMDMHRSYLEKEIVKSADFVFSSSEKIKNEIKAYNPKCFKIPHGIRDYHLHNNDLKFKNRIEYKSKKIKVGYVGNLNYRGIDTNTLKKIIEGNTDIEFEFIGPYKESNISNEEFNKDFIEYLKSKKNVRLKGTVPSVDLFKEISKYDVFLICYSINNITQVSNSHKILEFLSTGKVVVSNYIDEYKDNDLIILTDKNDDLPAVFKNVIDNLEFYNSYDLMKKRYEFTLDYTYKSHIRKIEKLLSIK